MTEEIKELGGAAPIISSGSYWYTCGLGGCPNCGTFKPILLERGQRYKVARPNGMLVLSTGGDWIKVHEFTYMYPRQNTGSLHIPKSIKDQINND